MELQKIEQDIRIIMMRLNAEDNPERTASLEKQLKKLNFQKEIAIIRQKIEALD